jgi:hypothetical protein
VGASSDAREEERRVVWGAVMRGVAGAPFIGAEGEGANRVTVK